MIVDSTLGQNSVNQVRSFHEALGLTGLVLTKLDGLSRGGTIFQLFQELHLPLCFLGMGEGPEDLIPFNPESFVEELFDQESASF
jgi:fused signal recognition particle receptor